MTAKKQVIQRLRKEIKELTVTNQNQRIAIRRSEHRIKTLKYEHFIKDENLASDIDGLRKEFNSELAWQTLSGTPNEQLSFLNLITKSIRQSIDYCHETYMVRNLDDPQVRFFYNQKLKREGKKV